ncbi:hypothetical protein CWC33_05625 [Idiomarina sp. X4]|uniref:hypothetical protein n=1 Tax=Idiomarina sp. X4 TaxID=2055892 RepID=UPI000C28C236|nr:hypothetical protein [Idiomarina sp. X4]ATZ73210.1 hypothetical protein CWC33_05625 [Idiomarina sp. X4]
MWFPAKIFLKGFLRWLVISAAIIFTIFAIKLGLNEELTVQHFSLVSWQATKFIFLFSSLSGAVDVFLYWLKARENKERA